MRLSCSLCAYIHKRDFPKRVPLIDMRTNILNNCVEVVYTCMNYVLWTDSTYMMVKMYVVVCLSFCFVCFSFF